MKRLLKFVTVLLVFILFKHVPACAQVANATDDAITLTTQPTNDSKAATRNYTGSDNNGLYSNPIPLGLSNDPNSPPTPAPQLGTFDLNGNSTLSLVGAQLQGLLGSTPTTVTAVRLEYRVYPTGTATSSLPGYSNLALSASQTGTAKFDTYTGSATSAINLLSGLTSGGTYTLDVRFATVASRPGKTVTTYDPSSDYFYANFYVTPPPTGAMGYPPGFLTLLFRQKITRQLFILF